MILDEKYEIELQIFSARKDLGSLDAAYWDNKKRLIECKKRVSDLEVSVEEVSLKREEAIQKLNSLEEQFNS